MSEKKYVVPEGMRRAAGQATHNVDPEGYIMLPGLEAAVRWLAENPIVPTDEQWSKLPFSTLSQFPFVQASFAEWQRRMFLAPEPCAVEVVKDLLWLDPPVDLLAVDDCGGAITQEANLRILEAYRRGRISHDEK